MPIDDRSPHLPSIEPLGDAPGRPAPPPLVSEARDLATQDVPCRHCGFNLRGLSPQGNCPECGAPIQRSLGGDYLIYSDIRYVDSLHRGAIYIIISAILSLIWSLFITSFSLVRGFSMRGGGMQPSFSNPASMSITGSFTYDFLISLVALPLAAAALYGWWLFSERDPAQRYGDNGERPRLFVRMAVIFMAGATVVSLIVQALIAISPSVFLLQIAIGVLVWLVSLAQYFAALFYIRWLAPRLPSAAIKSRAELYMWLLPVIYLVGSCLVVGPLVAMIMYFLLINKVRLALKGVIQQLQNPMDSPGAPQAA